MISKNTAERLGGIFNYLTSIELITSLTEIDQKRKSQTIIVTFPRYNIKKEVFMNKRKFKGTNIFVTERFTPL